jgi:hypothetical protein
MIYNLPSIQCQRKFFQKFIFKIGTLKSADEIKLDFSFDSKGKSSWKVFSNQLLQRQKGNFTIRYSTEWTPARFFSKIFYFDSCYCCFRPRTDLARVQGLAMRRKSNGYFYKNAFSFFSRIFIQTIEESLRSVFC